MHLPFLQSNISGGRTYSQRATRYRDTLWRNFRTIVETWCLGDARLGQETFADLVLLGCNAGQTLPDSLLRKARRLTLIDPDINASSILQQRAVRLGCKTEIINRNDLLSEELQSWIDKSYPESTARESEPILLFTNVLGQNFIGRKKLTRGLRTILPKQSWASYHDVYSLDFKNEIAPSDLNTLSRIESKFLLQSRSIEQRRRQTQDPEAPLHLLLELLRMHLPNQKVRKAIDHETTELGATQFALWPITPAQLHIIGFTPTTDPARSRPNTVSR